MFQDLIDKFEKIGASARVRIRAPRRLFRSSNPPNPVPLTIDIANQRGDEVFDIVIHPDFKNNLDFQVQQIVRQDRHLVLVARELDQFGQPVHKHHFLCGHDERHWFVAGISPVSRVDEAKAALKPEEIRQLENFHGLRGKRKSSRRNNVFVRQGEWFFVPTPNLYIDPKFILQNEPIRRGLQRSGKPHWAEFAFRIGGESVKVCRQHPNGLTNAEYENLIQSSPRAVHFFWSDMKRNPTLYAKGRITHPDHATVMLSGWHKVMMNTERRTETIAFLD